MIFRLRVRGRSSTNSTVSGRYDVLMSVTIADESSVASFESPSTPGIGTQAQTIADPFTGCGMPNTAASASLPVAIRMPSSSAGPVRLPEILMVTSERPRM